MISSNSFLFLYQLSYLENSNHIHIQKNISINWDDIKLNKKLIFGLTIIIFSLFFIQPVFSQEPQPPRIPEPSPEPKPIKIPDPEPIREPFPEESDTAKIQRLTEENIKLREENFVLQVQITELNKIIENLHAITMEQIKVIMELVTQLREAVFEELFPSTVNL